VDQNQDGDSFLRTGDVVYVRWRVLRMERCGVRCNRTRCAGFDDGGRQCERRGAGDGGGRDFALSQFNRATQAQRQVGSSFKPYVYTTAIEAGRSLAISSWMGRLHFRRLAVPIRRITTSQTSKGAMTLLEAFAESRNIPALKLAARYGIAR